MLFKIVIFIHIEDTVYRFEFAKLVGNKILLRKTHQESICNCILISNLSLFFVFLKKRTPDLDYLNFSLTCIEMCVFNALVNTVPFKRKSKVDTRGQTSFTINM